MPKAFGKLQISNKDRGRRLIITNRFSHHEAFRLFGGLADSQSRERAISASASLQSMRCVEFADVDESRSHRRRESSRPYCSRLSGAPADVTQTRKKARTIEACSCMEDEEEKVLLLFAFSHPAIVGTMLINVFALDDCRNSELP